MPFEKTKFSQKLPITPLTRRGTGKTYASAFALREMLQKRAKETGRNVRALFLVHREQIAKQALRSYKNVFGERYSFGLLSGNSKNYKSDILFSTMQMMAREDIMKKFNANDFDIIIIDDERVIIRTKLEKPSKIKGLALI